MRFLIIDANYSGFLAGVYRDSPALASAPYDEQRAHIRAGMFGEAGFQVEALRALGHEADVIITNAHAAQHAWAREHGVAHRPRARWRLRLRRGAVPWLQRSTGTAWDIVLAQVAAYRPDVLYVGILDSMPTRVVAELRPFTRLVCAQIAAAIPAGEYGAYDLVFSSIPAMVERFRRMNIAAEWIPLAFEPSVVTQVPPRARDVPVSFIGSISDVHVGRLDLLEAVARVAPLKTWTSDTALLSRHPLIRPSLQGSAFGRDMYAVLARSRITLNSHAEWSGQDANNLRLYEATGMGALLVTDHRANLNQLFDVGSEIVSYRTPAEAAELVGYYLAHPDEADRISAAGQARTLRDHTWTDRMARVVATVHARL